MIEKPTTQEIGDQIVAQISAQLEQTVPLLPKLFTRVLAKVLAGAFVLLYHYAGFSLLQMFVQYASFKETSVNGQTLIPLVEWGRLIGVGDPNAGTRAELVVAVTVENQTGSLPGGSQLVRADTGVIYQTTAAVLLDAASVQVTIQAIGDPDGNAGVGAIGTIALGDIVTFANPLPNVASDAAVLSVAVSGADPETEKAYRARIKRRFQAKPQGGAYADYRVWAEEVDGVANAYPYTGDPGEVDVYVEGDDPPHTDGILTGGAGDALLAAVEASIQFDEAGLATRRNANTLCTVAGGQIQSITRVEFGVTVGGLVVPDAAQLADVQAAIEAGVDEYLRAREPFILGLSVLPRLDSITQGAIGGVVNEIANANGATVSTVVLLQSSVEINAYELDNGQKAKLEAAGITWE